MDELLDEFFRQFDQDEQQIITAAKASADEILANGTAAAKVRVMASGSEERQDWVLEPEDDAHADAAGLIYAAYVNALWRKTDSARDASIQNFLASMDQLVEPVLKRYGCQAKGWIDELRSRCRLSVSIVQSGPPQNGLPQTVHTDTSHATEQTEALKSRSSAADGFTKSVRVPEILQFVEPWRRRQRSNADYESLCARRLGRGFAEFNRQEELLRDAHTYGKSLLTQIVSETQDVLVLIQRIALDTYNRYVPTHPYYSDFRLGYAEFQSALTEEGWPSLSDRATSALQRLSSNIAPASIKDPDKAGEEKGPDQLDPERAKRATARQVVPGATEMLGAQAVSALVSKTPQRRGRRRNQERRNAIHNAIAKYGEGWRDHLGDVLKELDSQDVPLGDLHGKELDLDGEKTKVSKWDDLDLTHGEQRKGILDVLRKYVD